MSDTYVLEVHFENIWCELTAIVSAIAFNSMPNPFLNQGSPFYEYSYSITFFLDKVDP